MGVRWYGTNGPESKKIDAGRRLAAIQHQVKAEDYPL
jgi:hypothetical protein